MWSNTSSPKNERYAFITEISELDIYFFTSKVYYFSWHIMNDVPHDKAHPLIVNGSFNY